MSTTPEGPEMTTPDLFGGTTPVASAGFLTATCGHRWHAVPSENVKYAREGFATAACGLPALVSKAELQPYRRDAIPVTYAPCAECAWAVAHASGTLDDEAGRLVPTDDDLAVLGRYLPFPGIAAHACRNILAVGRHAHGAWDLGENPEPAIQLLAAVTRHAPVILLPEGCAEGDCEHGYEDDDGTRHECGRWNATVACAACSLQDGDGNFRPECTIAAPCAVLSRLAEAARGAVDDAEKSATVLAGLLRERAAEATERHRSGQQGGAA